MRASTILTLCLFAFGSIGHVAAATELKVGDPAPDFALVLAPWKAEHSEEVLRMDELLMRREQAERVRRAVERLPMDFREVIVLRELEGFATRK